MIYGVEKKFGQETEKVILSEDFLKVEDFQNLPKMIKPLTLKELKSFFRQKAKELGMTQVEK